MAMCPWHHTYKVYYKLKGDVSGPNRRIDFVEAASSGMAWQQVEEQNGGPLNCQVWKVEQVD